MDNFGVSTGTIVIQLFENDYFLSNIYMFLFCYHFDSNVSIQRMRMCYNLQIHSTTKETLVPRPPVTTAMQVINISPWRSTHCNLLFILLLSFLILFFDHKYDDLDCFLRRSRRMRTNSIDAMMRLGSLLSPHQDLRRRRPIKMIPRTRRQQRRSRWRKQKRRRA